MNDVQITDFIDYFMANLLGVLLVVMLLTLFTIYLIYRLIQIHNHNKKELEYIKELESKIDKNK